MSKLFSRRHLCFFKLKCPTCSTTPLSPPHPHHRHHQDHTSSPPPSSSTSTTFNLNHHSDTTDITPVTDFAAVFASHRFFFSSPGHSNSIIPSPASNTAHVDDASASIPRGSVVVPMYSLNPYMDFRRSMLEMIESRESDIDVRKDWDYLHDLLLCYLALNPTRSHKYIIDAFTDVIVDLLSWSEMAVAEPNRDQIVSQRPEVKSKITDTDY